MLLECIFIYSGEIGYCPKMVFPSACHGIRIILAIALKVGFIAILTPFFTRFPPIIRYEYMRQIKNSLYLDRICDSVAFGIKAYMFEIRNGRVWI